MRTLILSVAIPLFLLGACSTLQGKVDGHDAHHPKMAPAVQDSAALGPNADGMNMAAKADTMKNCPMMKADSKAPVDEIGAGRNGASGGIMKDCPPSDQMMANCPMKKGDKAGMPMSGDGMMKNCPMKDNQTKADTPH